MKLMHGVLFLSLTLASTSVFAKGKRGKQGKNIWVDCGIGALLFPETAWAAVTSNVIWDLGTTASSSTSSSEDQCNGRTASAAKFLYQNYAMIEEDTVMGGGQYFTSVLDILGCNKNSRGVILEATKSEFGKNLTDGSYTQKPLLKKAESYYDVLMNSIDKTSASSCAAS